MRPLLFLLFCCFCQSVFGQVYVEKQTRHRFAQLNLGLDVQSSFGGETKFIDENGTTQTMSLSQTFSPRFLIGGTHFWGHADFYIGIPLYTPAVKNSNQIINAYRGVETVFKYYPWRIETKKLRPYVGISLAPFYYEQSNENFEFPSGPEINQNGFPLLGGLSYSSKNLLFDCGIAWNYANKQEYYISETQAETISTAPFHMNLSVRYMLETTLSAEKDWESGRTEEVTTALAEMGKLDGFYVGAGISSAFWLRNSEHNKNNNPFINIYSTSIMPDFTLGYYLHNLDANFALSYRGMAASTTSYSVQQVIRRRSVVLEASKYLFDYHGFVPFLGPYISYENLGFQEAVAENLTHDLNESKLGYGILFGWDIRPNRIQTWLLRTNLRWNPNLFIETGVGEKVYYDNIEFNFIQLIIYPSRMF